MIGSSQAEIRVMSAALASRRARLAAVAALTPAHFLDAAHREVWSVIAELTRAGQTVSLETVKAAVTARGLAWLDRLEDEALALIDPTPLINLVKQLADARGWCRQAKSEIRRLVPDLPPEILTLADQTLETALKDPAVSQAQARVKTLIDETVSAAKAALETDQTQGRAAALEAAADYLPQAQAAAKAAPTPADSEATWNRVWSYAQPVWFGRIGNFEFKRQSPGLQITTGRYQPAARAVINLTNFRRELEGKISVGDPVLWQWGYADRPGDLTTIIEGFVSNVIEAREMVVEAHDALYRVWAVRRTKSFTGATAGQILSWFLDQAAMPGQVTQGGKLAHFAANDIDASAVAARLQDSLTRLDGVDRSEWAHFIDRTGQFVWGPYAVSHNNLATPPEFRLKHNIVEYQPAARPGRLSRIKTFAVPEVRHSMDIKVRGVTHRAERVSYRQRPGSLRMEISYS